jgi:23S rRNA pseudouridine2605 synthase
MVQIRLQKALARAGVASRRKAEELIRAGRVTVQGRVVTELGTRVDPRVSRVEVDGRRVTAEPLVYVLLHKPRGVMCTLRDPEGRPCLADYVRQIGARVTPVGRLDYHTSGVLLLTNDGELSSTLQHPRQGVPKVYVAKVRGIVTDEILAGWTQSIVVDGRATRPAAVRLLRHEGGKTWLEVTLTEGRNRQVRRLGEVTGFPVLRLARLAYAGISCEGLRPGRWRHLSVEELRQLKRAHGVPRKVRPAAGLASLAPNKRGRGRRPASGARSGVRQTRR